MPGILIVDSNRLLNRFTSTYIRGRGMKASSLADFTKVESWLESVGCDVVIIEPRDSSPVPKRSLEDNIDLISRIREAHPEIKIICFSENFDKGFIDKVKKAGADAYVSKSLGHLELWQVILRTMGKKMQPSHPKGGGARDFNYLG